MSALLVYQTRDGLNDVDDFLGHLVTGEADLPACSERDLAISNSEECVVFADLYILSCLDLRAALADDDSSRLCYRAVRKLHPEILRVRIG